MPWAHSATVTCSCFLFTGPRGPWGRTVFSELSSGLGSAWVLRGAPWKPRLRLGSLGSVGFPRTTGASSPGASSMLLHHPLHVSPGISGFPGIILISQVRMNPPHADTEAFSRRGSPRHHEEPGPLPRRQSASHGKSLGATVPPPCLDGVVAPSGAQVEFQDWRYFEKQVSTRIKQHRTKPTSRSLGSLVV